MSKKESANLYKISVVKYALRENWGSEEDPFVLHKVLKTALKLLESPMQKASTTEKWKKVETGNKQTGTWWKEETNMTVLMRSILLLLHQTTPFSQGVHRKLDKQCCPATKPTLVKAEHEWENKTKCQSVQLRFPEIIFTYYVIFTYYL